MSRRDQIALFLLIGSLLGNLGLLFKWQWERETVNSLGYAFEIANAVPKIRHGMSKEEAIRLIGRAPDEETKNEHGNFCS